MTRQGLVTQGVDALVAAWRRLVPGSARGVSGMAGSSRLVLDPVALLDARQAAPMAEPPRRWTASAPPWLTSRTEVRRPPLDGVLYVVGQLPGQQRAARSQRGLRPARRAVEARAPLPADLNHACAAASTAGSTSSAGTRARAAASSRSTPTTRPPTAGRPARPMPTPRGA